MSDIVGTSESEIGCRNFRMPIYDRWLIEYPEGKYEPLPKCPSNWDDSRDAGVVGIKFRTKPVAGRAEKNWILSFFESDEEFDILIIALSLVISD